jgi:hypothetical protein
MNDHRQDAAATKGAPGTEPGAVLAAPSEDARRRRRLAIALAVIVTCQMMVIVDASIVNIALPRIAGRPLQPGSNVAAGTRAATAAGARRIDFDRPETLTAGFGGVDVLVFVSAGYAEDDVVLASHGAVIAAAASVGVRHVIYTSLAGSADRLTIALAHRWTEARLAESGLFGR